MMNDDYIDGKKKKRWLAFSIDSISGLIKDGVGSG